MTQIAIYDEDVETVEFTYDEMQINLRGSDDPQVYRLACGQIIFHDDAEPATGRLYADVRIPTITRADIRPILKSLELIL